jgi:hypothetical protein
MGAPAERARRHREGPGAASWDELPAEEHDRRVVQDAEGLAQRAALRRSASARDWKKALSTQCGAATRRSAGTP